MMRHPKNNSVYFGTERRLLKATAKVLKKRHYLGLRTSEISRTAGLAGSSFYIHYRSLSDLIDKNQQKILKGLNRIIIQEKRHSGGLESFFRNVLLYLHLHRELLDLVVEVENVQLPLLVTHKIRPIVTRNWNSYGKKIDDRIYLLFEFNCIAEFSIWRSEKFSIDTLVEHSRRLTYFATNTPRFFAQIYYK